MANGLPELQFMDLSQIDARATQARAAEQNMRLHQMQMVEAQRKMDQEAQLSQLFQDKNFDFKDPYGAMQRIGAISPSMGLSYGQGLAHMSLYGGQKDARDAAIQNAKLTAAEKKKKDMAMAVGYLLQLTPDQRAAQWPVAVQAWLRDHPEDANNPLLTGHYDQNKEAALNQIFYSGVSPETIYKSTQPDYQVQQGMMGDKPGFFAIDKNKPTASPVPIGGPSGSEPTGIGTTSQAQFGPLPKETGPVREAAINDIAKRRILHEKDPTKYPSPSTEELAEEEAYISTKSAPGERRARAFTGGRMFTVTDATTGRTAPVPVSEITLNPDRYVSPGNVDDPANLWFAAEKYFLTGKIDPKATKAQAEKIRTEAYQIMQEQGESQAEMMAKWSFRDNEKASLKKQQGNRNMMSSFIENLEGQVDHVKKIYTDMDARFGARILDYPIREIKKKLAGSGDEAIVDMYLTEIGNEMARLSQGNAQSIAMLPEGAAKRWEGINDPNLSLRELGKIMDETKVAAQLRVHSVDREIPLSMKRIEQGMPLAGETEKRTPDFLKGEEKPPEKPKTTPQQEGRAAPAPGEKKPTWTDESGELVGWDSETKKTVKYSDFYNWVVSKYPGRQVPPEKIWAQWEKRYGGK